MVFIPQLDKKILKKAYKLGANSYVEKPLELAKFIEAMLKIEDFWLYLAKKTKWFVMPDYYLKKT